MVQSVFNDFKRQNRKLGGLKKTRYSTYKKQITLATVYTPKLATPLSRITAFLIDIFGVYFCIVILMTPFRIVLSESALTVTAWIVFTIYMAYFFLRDAFPHYCIGKRIMSIRTVTNDDESKPCGIWQSFLRNLVVILSPLNLLEIFVLLLRKDRRRIGDFLASTKVIEAKKNRL